MRNRVLALPEVRSYFADLIRILYENEYFSFEDDAVAYVTELFSDIEKSLPTKSRKPAPEHFNTYGKGMYYASFRKNRRTQWYVFFTIHEDRNTDTRTFLIRYVSNNHMVAQYLQ